ncbi:PIG-L deacetylase family protein [Haloechinothrix halophila]|uniref:PIG-L deacetylase family protein n=1 Tax=Haloechinothrix halophila TaxID=1069073 RepID=UPI0004221A7B|nr:PIG-L family deacetylase [Haloechinothrix halophila]
MIRLRTGSIERIAAVGAHCDDIAIGAGGSLYTACLANPGVRVDALVLTGGGTDRETEEHTALTAFCPGADIDVTVLKLPDGRTPAHWDEAKSAVRELRQRADADADADVVFAPHLDDAHQDHRLLAELVSQTFRDHLVLGYEIVKSDGDLGRPAVYRPLRDDVMRRKVELLHEYYPSQRHRPWFDREAFVGLARIRGIECGARYAEAFHTTTVTLDLEG